MKLQRLIVGNLDIQIDEERNQISIHKADLMPRMDMQEIPEEAELFWGTIEQFEDFLGRMHKKYGHLYRRR